MYIDNILNNATNDLIHATRQSIIVSHIIGRIIQELIESGRVRVDPNYNFVMAEDSVIWVYEFLDEYNDCLTWPYDYLEDALRGFVELRIFESNYMDE